MESIQNQEHHQIVIFSDGEWGATDSPRYVTLSSSAFLELAGGGGSPSVIRALRESEYSHRRIALRAFLEIFDPLPQPIEKAWSALERAERQDRDAVAAVVMHPQVGSWLAYTLRRHRGGAVSTAPIGHDLGQVQAVALAAAAATGQEFRATVPLRAGRVMVPRFGMAHFPDCAEWDVAEAGTDDGHLWFRHGDRLITVPPDGSDAPGWWALRRVSVGEDPALTVWLDDLDPFRDLADPVPPARLTDAEADRWRTRLRGAWKILVDTHRPLADSLAVGVTSLVPLPPGDGWETRSASTGDAFGAVLCSPPPDAVKLAETLAHEFAHIKLGALMHLFRLTGKDDGRLLHAPWRDDPRPAGGLLQGIYAFHAITDFWRTQRSHPAAASGDFEYAYARAQTTEALDIARRDGGLTERGRQLVDGLTERMRGWQSDEIDEEAGRLARLVTDAHRVGWRIRHCRPHPADVTALAEAVRTGTPPRTAVLPAETLPDPEMRQWSGPRLGLARRRLLAPHRQAEARGEGWGAALTDADLALVAGDTTAAAAGFAEELEKDPASPDAWTGLGLALRDPALLSRPDLVLAVHRACGGAHSPEEVARRVGLGLEFCVVTRAEAELS